jgi:hypothetical protein
MQLFRILSNPDRDYDEPMPRNSLPTDNIFDKLVESLGKWIVSKDYELPEFQRSAGLPIADAIEAYKRTKQYQAVARFVPSLKNRNINLMYFDIDAETLHVCNFHPAARVILFLSGMHDKAVENMQPETGLLFYGQRILHNTRAPRQFSELLTEAPNLAEEAVYRIVRPLSLLTREQEQDYFSLVTEMFRFREPIGDSLYKIVAVADEITKHFLSSPPNSSEHYFELRRIMWQHSQRFDDELSIYNVELLKDDPLRRDFDAKIAPICINCLETGPRDIEID